MSAAPPGTALHGIAGSPGIAVGRAFVVGAARRSIVRRRCESEDHAAELDRFRAAVERTRTELRAISDSMPPRSSAQSIVEAYALMVDDPMLSDEVERRIVEQGDCAEWSVSCAIDKLAAQLAASNDAYLRERSHDVERVGEHLLRNFDPESAHEVRLPRGAVVLVARDLSPADAAKFWALGSGSAESPPSRDDGPGRVVAIVVERGSRTSHVAITARAHELPAVVGLSDATERIATGDDLVVDGLRGVVHVRPSDDELALWSERAGRFRATASGLAEARDRACITLDGVLVTVRANLELPEEASRARDVGADGVGLFRTEYLYIDRTTLPDEAAQLAAFRSAIEGVRPADASVATSSPPITLRTFDIGGDKFASSLTLPDELNPMLGLRAVRLAMSRADLFLEHLRAMVRATAHGSVRIMVPMVTTIEELRWARAQLQEAVRQVVEQGCDVAAEIPLGVMIEVPGAALLADHFAREAAFMSIGTNDLIQYTLAVDRSSRRLAHLASPFDPSIARLIDGVVRAGARHGCPVSVCGAMAGDPLGALLLLGLGVREFSMAISDIPELREVFRRVSTDEARELALRALELDSARAVEALFVDAFSERLHDLLESDLADDASTARGLTDPGSQEVSR
jgi:phosphotransferase system enzyme I (PtsI)